MPSYKYLIFTNATEGNEPAFNEWYNNVHLPDIANTGAFKGGERFKVVASKHTPPADYGYAAIYEVEGDDPEAALDKLTAAFGKGELRPSEAIDMMGAKPILLQSLDVKLPAPGA